MDDNIAATLSAQALTRRFGDRVALSEVSFELAAGELTAIIGPNGAGKTTLLSILAGALPLSSGRVQHAGGAEHQRRGSVGWVPQQPALYSKLSVAENLRLFARLEGVEDPDAAVAQMLEQTALQERANDQVGSLSGGNQQRVNIAIGLLSKPVVLLLDEPSSSLDPRQRARLWEFIGGLARLGTSVLYSTHDVYEAQQHADRVLALDQGRLVFDGVPAQMDWNYRPMRWLLLKDLRILRRSPLLVGVLVLYPALIGLLIGFALSSPPGKPKVAIYTGVPVGHSLVSLGGKRIDVAQYAQELYASITPLKASSPAQAIADVRSGQALAALIIPSDTVTQIQDLIATGDGNPTVQVVLNDKNPLERDLVQQALDTRVDDVQTAISRQLLKTVVSDLRLVLSGGKISFLGSSLQLLGLRNTRTIVEGAVVSLPAGSALVPALDQVSRFATVAIDGLALAAPEIGSVAAPLTVQRTELSGKTTPTASYAIAIAAVVLLMFVTLLLAAGMLALERSENAYRRLIGLLRPSALLAEKVVLATLCAFVLTLVMSAIVSGFVALDWGRFELWVLALLVGGLAFAALGVAVGALARDVSIASLLAFLISLPVAFVALVPNTAVSGGLATVLNVISFVFPFRAALQAVANAFTGTSPAIGLPLLHLLGLTVVFALLARLGLTRFADW